jgi:hypothetical protein
MTCLLLSQFFAARVGIAGVPDQAGGDRHGDAAKFVPESDGTADGVPASTDICASSGESDYPSR